MSNLNHLTAIEAELEALGEAPLSAAELQMLQQVSEHESEAAGDGDEIDFGIDADLLAVFAAEAEARHGQREARDEATTVAAIAARLAEQANDSAHDSGHALDRAPVHVEPLSAPRSVGPGGGAEPAAQVIAFAARRRAVYVSAVVGLAAATVLVWALQPEFRPDSQAGRGIGVASGSDARAQAASALGDQARRSLKALEQIDARKSPMNSESARRSRWARLLAMRQEDGSDELGSAGKERR